MKRISDTRIKFIVFTIIELRKYLPSLKAFKKGKNIVLDYSSQKYSVLQSLLLLIKMILQGRNINSESSNATNQAALSLAQLIKINSVKRKRRERTICSRYTLSQETPLPVYLVLMIHSKLE